MNLLENARIAFDSLWSNRLRSFLALLGIVIGVFAVTSMISLGEMAQAGISRDLESVAGRSVFVQANFNAGEDSSTAPIRDEDLLALERLPVRLVPQVFTSAQYEARPGQRRSLTLNGTPGDLPRLDATNRLAQGRYFTDAEARGGLPVAVLSDSAARDLFGSRNPLGQTARLYLPSGARLEPTVVGVLEPPPGLFGGFAGSTVYVPNALAWSVSSEARRGEYSFVTLVLEEGASATRVAEDARRVFDTRYGKDRYQVQSAESFQGTLRSITLALQALLGGIAGLSLLVGGIGIMNIMLVSVTERTREIGLRKALGATARLIRQQFLIEAVVLTLAGGALGVLLAVGLLAAAVAAVPFFGEFVLNPLTVAVALSVSALVGLGFGVVPAARAARLDPIESLRYE